jgi:hypothetical protein
VGPQEKIYRHISDQLLGRDDSCRDLWPHDAESRSQIINCTREIAVAMRWPNDFFIPADPFAILCWDKSACAVDDLRVSSVLSKIEQNFAVPAQSTKWWEACWSRTFGEVIKGLLEIRNTSRSD